MFGCFWRLSAAAVRVRAGFVSLETMLTGYPGMLVTRPLIFGSSQTNLFVNAVVQPGGFIQIGVKGSSSLTLRASSVSYGLFAYSRQFRNHA